MFYKFQPLQSPSSFSFTDPDTGFKFQAMTLQSLRAHVISYRAQNQLPPIEQLDAVLENYLCGLPENRSRCTVAVLPRSLRAYIKGGVALIKNFALNKMVPQAEADRRSRICVGCPFNVNPDKGFFESWSDDIATASVGPRRSKHHAHLFICGVCTCPLSAKVWAAGPFDLTEEEKEKMRTVNCWQLEDNG